METSSQLYMNCYWSGLKSYARSKEQSVWTDTWMTFLLHFLKLSRYGNTSLRFFILVCWVFLPYAMFLHRYPHFILWYECNMKKVPFISEWHFDRFSNAPERLDDLWCQVRGMHIYYLIPFESQYNWNTLTIEVCSQLSKTGSVRL